METLIQTMGQVRSGSEGIGAINQMDQVVQTNAAMVEQSTAATHSLNTETGELSRLVARFDIGGGAARTAPRPAGSGQRPVASPARALAARVERSMGSAAAASGGPQGWEEF